MTRIETRARYVGDARTTTDLVVWHATGGASASSTINWQNRPNLPPPERTSYHAIIERSGKIYLCAPVQLRAFHAGRSAWPVREGQKVTGSLNPRSLGIAFANRCLPEGDPQFERITEQQLTAAIELLRFWLPRYPWLGESARHVRHRDVSPGRKSDPLPSTIDWPAFLQRISAEVVAP